MALKVTIRAKAGSWTKCGGYQQTVNKSDSLDNIWFILRLSLSVHNYSHLTKLSLLVFPCVWSKNLTKASFKNNKHFLFSIWCVFWVNVLYYDSRNSSPQKGALTLNCCFWLKYQSIIHDNDSSSDVRWKAMVLS